MDSILSVLATIAIIFGVVMLFNFMIFIHELGHFFAARSVSYTHLDVYKRQITAGVFRKNTTGNTVLSPRR